MTKQAEVRTIPAQEMRVNTDADGTRSLSGYAAVFNSRSVDLGGFTEILAPGCFSRSLQNTPDVLMLRDHQSSLLMGRTKSGTLQLNEDANGLRFSCKLPDTTQAADLVRSIERGDLDGCSFGFYADNDEWKENPRGTYTRTILEATLLEISAVSFPAYPSTSVSVRSVPPEIRARMDATAAAPPANDEEWMRRAQIRMGLLQRA